MPNCRESCDVLASDSCRSNGDLLGFPGDFSCQPNTDDNFSGHYKTKISHALHPPLRPIRDDQRRYPRLFSRQLRFASLASLKLSDIFPAREMNLLGWRWCRTNRLVAKGSIKHRQRREKIEKSRDGKQNINFVEIMYCENIFTGLVNIVIR